MPVENLFRGFTESRKAELLERLEQYESMLPGGREITTARVLDLRALRMPPEMKPDEDMPEDEMPMMLEGYAAVFNEPAEMMWWTEEIVPGAFSRAIREDDVRCLMNHDPSLILGRNRAQPSPTLELKEDARGLWYRVTLPECEYGRACHCAVMRGDISQSSFAFVPRRIEWEIPKERSEDVIRRLLEVELHDVAPVTYPAYQTTTVGARSHFQTFVQAVLEMAQERSRQDPKDRDLENYLEQRRRELELVSRAR